MICRDECQEKITIYDELGVCKNGGNYSNLMGGRNNCHYPDRYLAAGRNKKCGCGINIREKKYKNDFKYNR